MEKIEFKKEQFGKFIIASNDTEHNAEDLLSKYKDQSKVERGFRFLKDLQYGKILSVVPEYRRFYDDDIRPAWR